MDDDYFTNSEERTCGDLCEMMDFLEKNEVSEERSLKIYLLKGLYEVSRLKHKLNEMAFLRDIPLQFDLSPFFGSANMEEQWKKLVEVRKRLDRLWKLDREARTLNHLKRFSFKRIQAQYPLTA